MPPWILAAIPLALAGLGVAALVIRPLSQVWAERLSDRDLERMIGALKGAVAIARPIAATTPGNVDDRVVNDIVAAALEEFIRERGRRPKVTPETLHDVAKAVAVTKAIGTPVGYLGRLSGPEARVR